MSAPHAPFLKSAPPLAAPSRLHLAGEVCPICEQPIPHDRFDEIKERIETRQREQSAVISSRLQVQFAREKAEILEKAQKEAEAALERERQLVTEKMALAREEERQAAQAAAQEQIAAAERASQTSMSALQTRIEEAEAAKTSAEAARASLQVQIEAAQRESNSAIQLVREEAAAKEETIRQQAGAAAQAAAQERIAHMEQARAEAEAKAVAAGAQVRSLNETHEAQLAQRLAEQREAMERAQAEAVNAERSAAFEDKLKLSTKVDELQRALDKKTAEELGEGAEIDLFEALKAEFEGDRIERVNKGQPGADILHAVVHNGKECGKIIYDSKNHNGWRNEFVTKLATDQMAAKAEHAILSTRKFPAGARHLHVQDGVLLASPARIVALVTIVRQHLVQTHTLRLSNEARAQKTAALYGFITSERCADLLSRIDTHAEDLLEIQVKEKKAHEATWRRQGELIRSVQKVRAELCNEIDGIIGTAEAVGTGQ